MNHEQHMKKLEELYAMAYEAKDVQQALSVLDYMIASCVAEANKTKVA